MRAHHLPPRQQKGKVGRHPLGKVFGLVMDVAETDRQLPRRQSIGERHQNLHTHIQRPGTRSGPATA